MFGLKYWLSFNRILVQYVRTIGEWFKAARDSTSICFSWICVHYRRTVVKNPEKMDKNQKYCRICPKSCILLFSRLLITNPIFNLPKTKCWTTSEKLQYTLSKIYTEVFEVADHNLDIQLAENKIADSKWRTISEKLQLICSSECTRIFEVADYEYDIDYTENKKE